MDMPLGSNDPARWRVYADFLLDQGVERPSAKAKWLRALKFARAVELCPSLVLMGTGVFANEDTPVRTSDLLCPLPKTNAWSEARRKVWWQPKSAVKLLHSHGNRWLEMGVIDKRVAKEITGKDDRRYFATADRVFLALYAGCPLDWPEMACAAWAQLVWLWHNTGARGIKVGEHDGGVWAISKGKRAYRLV